MINEIISSITLRLGHDIGSVGQILAILLMILIMSIYEFVVYRLVSHRAMYNKSFHISIMVIPFFIGIIVSALQSNLVLTLGTIGALAIIRFRTAIKDPTDMVYLLWSIFIGITCGCQLYESCILTSAVVTIVLIAINLLGTGLLRNPYILVVNTKENIEEDITTIVKTNSKNYKLKSRNFTSSGIDYIYQVDTKNPTNLSKELENKKDIIRFSLIEYENDDVI